MAEHKVSYLATIDGSQVNKFFSSSEKESNNLQNKLNGFSFTKSILGADLLSSSFRLITNFAGNTAGKILSLTGEYEMNQVAFETMLGSTEKANEKMTMLQNFADKTNFSFQTLSTTYKKLLGAGNELDTSQLTSLADFTNATTRNMDQLAEAINDVNNSERWKEFRVQTKTAGDQTTLTFNGISKTFQNTGKDAQKNVANIIQEFGKLKGVSGMTEKSGETVQGKISTLSDTYNRMLTKIGLSSNDEFKKTIDKLTEMLQNVDAERLSNGLGKFANGFLSFINSEEVKNFGAGLLSVLKSDEVQKFGNFIVTVYKNTIGVAGTIFSTISDNFKGLVSVFSPFVEIFETISTSFSNILNYALEKMGGKIGLSSKFENIVNFVKTIFNVISFGVKLIAPVFEFIAKIVIDFTSTILNILDKVFWAVGKVANLLGQEEFKLIDKKEERQSYEYNKNNTLAENVFGKKVVTVFDTKTEKTKSLIEKKATEKKEVDKSILTGSKLSGKSDNTNATRIYINIGSLVKDFTQNIKVADLDSKTAKTISFNFAEELKMQLLTAVNDVALTR